MAALDSLPLVAQKVTSTVLIEVDTQWIDAASPSVATLSGLQNRIAGVVARGPRAAAWAARAVGRDVPVWTIPDAAVRAIELKAAAVRFDIPVPMPDSRNLPDHYELWFAEPGDRIEHEEVAALAESWRPAPGQAVVVAAQAALAQRLPLLVITASGGARMQESTLALMQMARTTAAITALKQAGLPYVVLLTHPTTGGVTASFAMQGDIQLAEPGALIGFAGPRVIQQTIGQTLPEGFQTAEYLLAHGMLDAVVKRADHRPTLANLLNLLTNPSTPPKHPPASGPKP
jgi:hypothetical protein